MAQTIKVTTTVDGVKFQGRKVHYCPKSLLGSVCETVAIRAASGSSRAMAAGAWGWPCSYEIDVSGVSDTVQAINEWHQVQDNRC
jgi:hypothetical protein